MSGGLSWPLPSQTRWALVSRVQALRELVLKYRESIVHVRTAAEHTEEKLKAEILFLKEQIQAEQCLKENLEETLQLEIENCKEELGEHAAEPRAAGRSAGSRRSGRGRGPWAGPGRSGRGCGLWAGSGRSGRGRGSWVGADLGIINSTVWFQNVEGGTWVGDV